VIYVRDILERALNQILDHHYDHDVETDFIVYQQQLALVAELRATYYRYLDNSEEIAAARAEVQALQNTIDQARIIAPFDGTVTEIFVNPGQSVSQGDYAVQIDDLENPLIELSIPQTEVNTLQIGQEARFTFDAIPAREYQGYVQEIAAAGNDVSGQTMFPVTIRVIDADELVKMGFTAYVQIIIKQAEDALLIPNQAVFYDEEGATYVMLENEDKSHSEIYVETGARSDAHTEVISGDISEGKLLVVNQVDGIKFEVGSGQALRAAGHTFR
jgi:HlyD family secretion protein